MPVKLECSGGLYYNDEKHSCDLPENVSCEKRRKRTYTAEPQQYITGECHAGERSGTVTEIR